MLLGLRAWAMLVVCCSAGCSQSSVEVQLPGDVTWAAVLLGGAEVRADLIVWATSASAAPWIRESGLAVDDKGFMLVDRHLESTSHRQLFGSGDIAGLRSRKLPKSGVFAVRKGPVLAHNLRAALRGKPLLPFITKPSALGLITTGDRYAVMAWGRFALAGQWVWRWKDFIDRRLMAKYRRPGAGG